MRPVADVLGVDFKGLFDFSASYLGQFSAALAEALPDIPLLFKDTGYQKTSMNRALICETRKGAEVLANLVEPVLEAEWSTDFHIFHNTYFEFKFCRFSNRNLPFRP